MAFALTHFFDPDFDFTHLTPKEVSHGRVDHYNLGYVQNVVKEQVLAELTPLEEGTSAEHDQRFITENGSLPAGPNTLVNPENPRQLLAAANGYVFYHNGKITVKKLLNIRRDVDFHTGNVVFVGDLCVHGSIRTGFEVHGKNILVKGTVEGAKLYSRGNIVTENGIKGAKEAVLDAKEHIRLPFCENAEIRAHKNIVIDGSCMHTDVWVGGNLAVKGRLQGGTVYANNVVYVEEQVGGGSTTATSICMGYAPFPLRQLTQIENGIRQTSSLLENYKTEAAKGDIYLAEFQDKILKAEKKLEALYRRRGMLSEQLAQNAAEKNDCMIIVPGVIRPGVELSIGGAYYKVNDYIENVRITLQNNELVFTSPAMSR